MADEVTIVVRAKDEFSGVLSNFGNIMTGIKSAIDLVGQGFQAFAGFAMQGLEAVASYERMSISLQSLTASQLMMNGAAKDMASAMQVAGIEAKGLLVWVQDLAIHSPFTQEGVANALRMAMAYGFNTDEAQRLTAATIDFVSASGQSEYAMERIARALGQISATGKLTGQDMMQLTAVGVPVLEILSQAFDKSKEQIIDMRAKGLLPAKETIEAITVWMETNFKGAAESFSLSWAGLLSTFEDLKQMGLRELFGGMAEALQPIAAEFATWLQTEGMDRLREFQNLAGTDNIFYALGTAIRVFQQAMDDNKSIQDAFIIGMQKFTDLSNINIDWGLIADQMDIEMYDAISNHDWSASGNAFGAAVEKFVTEGWGQGVDDSGSVAQKALGQAISDWFRGAVGDVYFEHSAQDIVSAMLKMLVQAWKDQASANIQWTKDIASDIANGLMNGLKSAGMKLDQWFYDTFVEPVRRILGISSPSTVFMQIGRDIVLGLVAGWGTTIGIFLSIVQSFINMVLELFAPVLSIFGIDLGTSTGTGTTGGGAGTHAGPGGTSTSGSVVNNFYGPVYFGDMSSIGYDCPSPSPLVAASANTLIRSGIG